MNHNLAHKNVKVFTSHDEILGLPATIFLLGITFSVISSVTVKWWFGVILGSAYFPFMYKIYSFDPKAIQVLKRNIFRKNYFWKTSTQSTDVEFF